MTTWFWDDRTERTPAQQMAIDMAMVSVMDHSKASLLRLYQWRSDTISLGANEAALRTWSREVIEQAHVPIVRRPTGGRAVWHDSTDLTYSWAGPSDGPAGVRQRYRILHEELARALSGAIGQLSLADRSLRTPGLVPGACFDQPVGGEVLANGRKAIGSAQLVTGAGLLQHGSISRRRHAGQLARFRIGDGTARAGDTPHDLPDADQLRAAIERHWVESGSLPAPQGLIRQVIDASAANEAGFNDPDWTWRR